MVDKKLVDDYYSKIEDISKESGKEEKKLQIKGKIKIKKVVKKESEVVLIEEKKEPKIKLKKPKIVQNIIPELEEKEEPKEEKKPNKKDKKQIIDNTKKGNYNTTTKKIEFGISDSKKEIDKNNNIVIKRPQDPIKKTFSHKPNVKTHNTDEDQNKNTKFLKKDKSFKHFKNKFVNNLDEDDISFVRSTKIKHEKKQEKKVEDIKQDLTTRAGETVIIQDILSIKELSEKIGISIIMLIAEFMKNGMLVNLNSKVDFETSSIIAESFGIKLQRDKSSGFKVEDLLEGNISELLTEEDSSLLKERIPVVSIMGHVDHGKTSLLDYIRHSKVADKEAGGITQSIGAYQVECNGKMITFLDTPGHEAFTIMRARGAKSTDIAILVVAADEGVKPQTIESINHAKEAGIPIIVAINKMDKEGANPEYVKGQLAQNGLQPEDWGGNIPMVPISAKAGMGIDELLEIILLQAELLELKANPDRLAVGTVIESHLDTQLGPVSTILINTGTLNKGDCLVCKGSYGRIKILKDFNLKNIKDCSPSMPVFVVGLDSVVEGGDIVQVVSDIEKARLKAMQYKELMSSKKSSMTSSIDMIMSKIKSGSLKQLKIVLKADTNGSLEAIKGSLIKLSTPETKVNIIHCGVGSVTQGDVLMCQGSSAILIGYNVDLIGNTKQMIDDTKVEYISSKIIYHITERIEKIITGMLDPKEVETILGEAVVGGIFYEGKGFTIIGLKLNNSSKIENKTKLRIIRKDKIIGKGEVANLKSGILDVNELIGPVECGIKFIGDVKIELKDKLEIYKIEIKK